MQTATTLDRKGKVDPLAELEKLLLTEYPKATLFTLERDSFLLGKVKALHDEGLLSMDDIEPYKRHAEQEKQKTALPLVSLTGSPTCGARSKRSGNPCLAPAMRGKKRCRFHGGKSTGRPVTTGLRGKAFQERRKAIKLIVAKMMANQPT